MNKAFASTGSIFIGLALSLLLPTLLGLTVGSKDLSGITGGVISNMAGPLGILETIPYFLLLAGMVTLIFGLFVSEKSKV